MNLNKLFEAVRKEYYDMNVLKVATEFPLELLRIFFSMFEDSVGKIAAEQKKQIIEEYKNKIEEKVNPWLDQRNENAILFDFEDVYSQRQHSNPQSSPFREENNNISIRFKGTRAKVSIANKNGRTSSEAKEWDTSITVREFFNKLIKYFKIIQKDEISDEDLKNPELLSQEDKNITLLNKLWNKHHLQISGSSTNKVSEKYINVYFNYNPLGNFKRKYEISDEVKFSFQLDLLRKFTREIKKFFNNKNYYITNIVRETKGFKYYYYYSENPNNENPINYSKTFIEIQDNQFSRVEELLNHFEVVNMTFQEFKRYNIKRVF